MKKGVKVWGFIVVLIFIVSCFSWVAGSSIMTDSSKSCEQEELKSTFHIPKQDEMKGRSICNVTLITGDVIIVSTLPDGKKGFAIKPADPTKLWQNFQIIETPKGTYVFPEGIDLGKVDKELFNIDYLVSEGYCNLTYLPVLVDYKKERVFGIAEQKEFEKEVNITIVKSYHAIPTFSAKLSFESINETFKTLVERPEIKKIWLDKKVHASLYESVPLIGAPELWKNGYDGSGMEIAILDTGIDDAHPDLDDLDNNPATNDPKVIVKKDFTDDNTTEDLFGHGTHCAGIAAGTGAASSEPYPTPTPVPTPTPIPPPSLSEFSMPLQTGGNSEQKVKKEVYSSVNTSQDAYEPDDNYWLANWIPTDGTKQLHNFHVPGDLDYVKFNATEDIRYLIETSDLGNESDTYMYLYDTDGLTEITYDDDSGEGLASRIIWGCDTSGTYYVKVRHFSLSASGPNTRYNISVLKGYTLPAEFNDVYSDYGEDTDGDGLYDYLVVKVGVNVTEAEDYRVSGELYENGTFNYVDYDSNTTYLNEGNQTVQLRFDGIRIRQNKYNGTYDLRYLGLYNATYPYPPVPGGGGGATSMPISEHELEEKIECGEITPENVSTMYGEQFDYRYYAYTTSYYNWTEFQRPPAEFTDVYSDYGEDTDGDGLNNSVVIEVGVNVTKAGTYRVRGELYENETGHYIISAYNTTYLDAGNHNVLLRFDGIRLRQNKYNGTYDLRYLGLYNYTYPYPYVEIEPEREGGTAEEGINVLYGEQLDYRYYAYTTRYYKWTGFQIPPAEFNDVYADYGGDTDGDGLYDFLVIEVGVNVTKEGRYQVSGSIYENATYKSVAYAYNTTYLSEGNQTVQLRFDGIRIRQNKYNGTYDLRYLYLYNMTYPYPYALDLEGKIARGEISPENVSVMYGEQLDYRYYAYTTGYYEWTEFQRPPAEFNDVYSDYGEDTNGDGLYDFLVIEVGVNVTNAGNYVVEGRLDDSLGGYIEWRSNYTYLNTGNQTVRLDFNGITIRMHGFNGTYNLKYLRLYDSNWNQLDYLYDAYTTSYYNYTDFQIPPAEFNDVYSDYGEDTNGDGLYDFLVIEVGVNVTKAGRYEVYGSLYENGTYNWVDYVTKSAYLSEGNQTIKLKFSGIEIRENGYNGTYDFKYLGLYTEWKEGGYKYWKQIDYRYYAYTTSHYNYTDFQEFPRYIGVAPGAYLWNVKVLNQYGWGYYSWVISGVEYAARGPDGTPHTGDEADIISMSLGGSPRPEEGDPLCQAVNEAVEQGLVVTVAAGNWPGYFTVSSPGTASKVITVGASTKYDELAWFSSWGPTLDFIVKPDVVAPGVGIIAPRASGTSMGYLYNDYYTEASGTSMATPHVAGAAALILQAHPDWTLEEVKNALISTADDMGYNVYQQGGGRIYVPSAVNPKILVEPATISFKNLETTNGTVTFKNLDTIMHNLTLDVTAKEVFGDTEVDCAYLNKTPLNIAPGSSASVLLTINDTSLAHSLYSGKVSATYSGGEVHSIFGFSTLNKVTVDKINMGGEPAVAELVVIFSDTEDAWIMDGVTDENGTVAFYLPEGIYQVISGWGDVLGASVYTIAENVSVLSDTNITLDERDVFVVDFDTNKSDQIMAERDEDVCYNGDHISVCFGALHWYPNKTKTYITPTTLFNGTLVHSYYPEEYYNATDPGLINTPEWHKLIFWQAGITENITFVADYDSMAEITTDYKVALEPDLAAWVQHAFCPGRWGSWTYVWRMNAPQRRDEWMSPEPAFYYKWYEQYAEWWNETYPCWSYDIPEQKYPAGTKAYFAIGEHPFKSGTKIDIPWESILDIYGTISEDTFRNSFANYSANVSGNLTVIKDGEVIIDHVDIWDYFYNSLYFEGTPQFKVIIQGNSSPRLSTSTRTELNFVADSSRDYQPPGITIRVFDWSSTTTPVLTPAQMSTPSRGGGGGGATDSEGVRVPSALYNIIIGGDVKVKMDVEDESNISDVTLEYSLDNGTTWNSTSIIYKGIAGCKPISGGNRTVIDETYVTPKYSKVRIFMDDTEDNDEIYYNYDFTLKKSDGTEYTKSGTSTSTLGDINDTLYYDEDNDGVLDLFKSIYIGAYTEDDDTLDVKVEGWNGTAWECLYGKKIRGYEADLGYMNNTFVSLRANATDSGGNSVSQTVIKGFYVSELIKIFDTGPGTYPSIFGMHNGTITPNQTITVSKLYTYPCPGTGGHTEYVRFENESWNITATWKGYKGDWHNISFDKTFMLVKGETYNYTIRTGSYPQIIHEPSFNATGGTITCTEFMDANGKRHEDWIPAIKL